MRILFLCGGHSRHLHVAKQIKLAFDETHILIMERENVIPSVPKNTSEADAQLFLSHFERRLAVERDAFGDITPGEFVKQTGAQLIKRGKINSPSTAQAIKDINPDVACVFGTDILSSELIAVLPDFTFNVHLGLSPWYRGSATLFWPFYHLKPQFAGVTFHYLTAEPDAGDIIHQLTPTLLAGQTLHEVAAECVLQTPSAIINLLLMYESEEQIKSYRQLATGRVWRERDFHPSLLRMIYQTFDDKIVDSYLSGELSWERPKLVRAF